MAVVILYMTLFNLFVIVSNLLSFTNALNFSFKSFPPSDPRVSYERGASADPKNLTIQLVPDIESQGTVGRATYFEPFQLWDEGYLSDFTTHFSFVVDSKGNSIYADGFAFFLAPAGSKLSPNTTGGASIGLTWDNECLNNTHGDPFVAVEFDIYHNDWDPEYEHVGINVNSMQSMATERWWCSLHEASRNDAWISYNSSSKQLSVVFTGRNNSRVNNYEVTLEVDLKTVLPRYVTFGFSAATAKYRALYSIYSWEFKSTFHMITKESPDSKKTRRSMLGVGLGVGGGFVLLGGFALVFLISLCKRTKRKEDDDFEKGTGPRKYSYHVVKRATNNFNSKAKLGEGGFGSVYRGSLSDMNSLVAVKKISKESKQGIKEFASEVKVFSQLRHRNLVKLIGWCHKKRKLLLVYEYMPNGSLDFHLFNATKLLIWEMRYKIAQGLASALLYLHEEWEDCVVHRDIKSSNIMLDSNFNAKLGDFGLARFVDHAKGSKTTDLIGTMGYMAPEYFATSKATKESDVYSFGIVALEIACGKRPLNPKAPEGQQVLEQWVWELYETGKVLEAADPRFNVGDYDEPQMEKLMLVGLWCAHPDCNLRPSIRQVNSVLNYEIPLPNSLPPRRPMDSFHTANQTTSSLGYCTADSGGTTSQLSTTSSQFTST